MKNTNDPSGEYPGVWLRCFHTENGLAPHSIQMKMNQEQVRVMPLLPYSGPAGILPAGPGIVVFNNITPEVYTFIQSASRDGTERVLAIAENEAALSGNWAWRLLKAGASDVLVWSQLPEPAVVIAARLRRWLEVDSLLESADVREGLVGESRSWKAMLRQVVEAARFTDSPILLMGETGTGKELIARLIHNLDLRRSQHPQVVVDCTTIVPELSGSELFGHEKGAFTGAINLRDGAFALSDQGTLFLDEVGELPLGLQVQLLRVLQEHTYKRVGSNIWHNTDFRLICATNRDLLYEESQGRFRQDLYYRIATWAFKLPPLRERSEDIIPLTQHFMKLACSRKEPPELDERVRSYLISREYPGNVRDLRNLIFRIMSRHVSHGPITIGDIPADERPMGWEDAGWRDEKLDSIVRRALTLGVSLRELTGTMKETAIRIAVENENGNLQRAALQLGITDRALQLWRGSKERKVSEAGSELIFLGESSPANDGYDLG